MGDELDDDLQLGHHVAAALVGTFLGILLCYGVIQPLANNADPQPLKPFDPNKTRDVRGDTNPSVSFLVQMLQAAEVVVFVTGTTDLMAPGPIRNWIDWAKINANGPSYQNFEGFANARTALVSVTELPVDATGSKQLERSLKSVGGKKPVMKHPLQLTHAAFDDAHALVSAEARAALSGLADAMMTLFD